MHYNTYIYFSFIRYVDLPEHIDLNYNYSVASEIRTPKIRIPWNSSNFRVSLLISEVHFQVIIHRTSPNYL